VIFLIAQNTAKIQIQNEVTKQIAYETDKRIATVGKCKDPNATPVKIPTQKDFQDMRSLYIIPPNTNPRKLQNIAEKIIDKIELADPVEITRVIKKPKGIDVARERTQAR
jgi:hypothetical protein